MKNQTLVAFSIYHLYISLVEYFRLTKEIPTRKTFLVMTDHIPNSIFLFNRIKELNLFDAVYFVHDMQTRERYSKEPFYQRFFNRKSTLIKLFQSDLNDEMLKNLRDSHINLFLDSTQFVQLLYYLFPNNKYRLYEDGERIYMKNKDGLKHWIKHYILQYPRKHGRDNQIKEILAQRPEDLPNPLKEKAKLFDLKKAVQSLQEKDLNTILNFFLDEFSLKIEDSGKKLLVITQPLSEDGYISEEYKIELYTRVIREYAVNYKVFIKPHPREKTDYSQFIKCQIIPNGFPIEILNYSGKFKFERGVTLFSSALKNYEGIEEKIFLGINWDKKVADAFPFKNI